MATTFREYLRALEGLRPEDKRPSPDQLSLAGQAGRALGVLPRAYPRALEPATLLRIPTLQIFAGAATGSGGVFVHDVTNPSAVIQQLAFFMAETQTAAPWITDQRGNMGGRQFEGLLGLDQATTSGGEWVFESKTNFVAALPPAVNQNRSAVLRLPPASTTPLGMWIPNGEALMILPSSTTDFVTPLDNIDFDIWLTVEPVPFEMPRPV